MRTRVLAVLLFVGVSFLTLSLIRGQEKVDNGQGVATPKTAIVPSQKDIASKSIDNAAATAVPLAPARDLSRFTGLSQQMLLTAQRGSDWLFRMHGLKGRFQPGARPALNQALETDNFFRQAGAATALARAARFCGEDRYAARATQAVLALLDDTTLDASDNLCRVISLPPVVVNRLGATGAVLLAINELPNPRQDLLDNAEQLCRSLRKMVCPDGTLGWDDGSGKIACHDDAVSQHPGLALQGLMASQRRRPADWKLDIVRKALPAYRALWKKRQDIEFATTMLPALADAYLLTREKPFAEFVCEVNDWLVALQYTTIDPRRALWFGGFRGYQAGKAVEGEPSAVSAACAEALIAGCRITADNGDLTRNQRYGEALERTLQFLVTLQFTDGNTSHYAAWYRPQILGAFHVSPTDGNIRIEDTQHAVLALMGYLEYVVR